MQPRHPNDYHYPNAKPARYTDGKKSAYFTQSGIAQLGYIREQLTLLAEEETTLEETELNITQIIALIDGLADKSMGSSLTVAKRLKALDENLMRVFPVENGAIVFNDIALLKAAKILTQGIAAMQPGDLDPPKAFMAAVGKKNHEACETIKSTMSSIGAQINFFIQLNENAIASQDLYTLTKRIKEAERNITYIQFIDEDILDHKIVVANSKIQPINLLNQISVAINAANECITEYANHSCSSITVHTRGAGLSPTDTFQLMLTTPCSLPKIRNDNSHENSIGDEELFPVFMTTSVPYSVIQLCRTLKGSLEKTQAYINKYPDVVAQSRIHEVTDRLTNTIKALESAMMQKEGNAVLKTNLATLQNDLLDKLERYKTSAKTSNIKKLAIGESLAASIKAINLDVEFGPDAQFSKFISIVASHYYQHNAYCADDKKSPGKLGAILVDTMNDLANFSANICANDSVYHQGNLDKINELLDRGQQNTNTKRR